MELAADRNLLFGILALQLDFIGRDQLVSAMNAWVLDKEKALGEVLVEQGALPAGRRQLLDALVDEHLKHHDGDPQQSLAALAPQVPPELGTVNDPGLQATLKHLETADPLATQGSIAASANLLAPLRYRMLRPHARGGLGEVFVALDQELQREVALKEIQSRHADDPRSRQRFVQEAEITGGLEHPGVVPVYGLGSYPDGRPFYAMRFIRGRSFKEAVDDYYKNGIKATDHALTFRNLLTRLQAVCQAVDYAHSRGVIHRDLKPANIMLGKYGETLVVDWGLAKAGFRNQGSGVRGQEPGVRGQQGGNNGASNEGDSVQKTAWSGTEEAPLRPASAGSGSETVAGVAVGTPQFMSPEQAAGRQDVMGPCSDVYSLGATLYYLLTGKAPIEDADLASTLRRVEHGDVPPPAQIRSEVPRPLEAVCRKAMALAPQDRYPSARHLSEDLEKWLADEPVGAWHEPWRQKLGRWLSRHRTGVVGVAVAMLVAFSLHATATILLKNANDRLSAANQAERQAREEAQKQTKLAQAAQAQAEEEKRLKVTEVQRSEWLLYSSRLNLAQRSWEEGNARTAYEILDRCRWDFRGWEHDFLWTRLRSNQQRYLGASQLVRCVALAQDAHVLAEGGDDHQVRVWVPGQEEPRLVLAHDDIVTALALTPNGALLASGCADRVVRVWHTKTGKLLHSLQAHKDDIHALDFDAAGTVLLSAGADQQVLLWDMATGKLQKSLAGHADGVLAARFTSKGTIVSVSQDRTAFVWDPATGKKLATWKDDQKSRLRIAAVSPGGRRIVTDQDGTKLVVWDLEGGKKPTALRGHLENVRCVAFAPDGLRLISGGEDNLVRVWDSDTGLEIKSYSGSLDDVTCLAVSPDGRWVLSSGPDRLATLWDISRDQEPMTLVGHSDDIFALAYSKDGRWLASGGADKAIKVWDASSGKLLRDMVGHGKEVRALAFRDSRAQLLSAGGDGQLQVWDAQAGGLLTTLQGPGPALRALIVLPNGRQAVSAGDDATLKIWDLAAGKDVHNLKTPTGVGSLAVNPEGTLLASGDVDGGILLWDAVAMKSTQALKGHAGGVHALAFSPDGKRLASASQDQTLKIWDTTTGACQITLEDHASPVLSVAWSPDGRRLASGGQDKQLKIWEVDSGHKTFTLTGQSNRIWKLAFSPSGRFLAGTGSGKNIVVWDGGQPKRVLPLARQGGAVSGTYLTQGPEKPGYLVLTSGDRHLQVWDAASGQESDRLAAHGQKPRVVAQDGGLVVSGGDEGTVILWDFAKKKAQAVLNHGAPVTQVGLGQSLIASASADGMVKIWDEKTRQEKQRFQGPGGPAHLMALANNGVWLANTAGDQRITLRDAGSGASAYSWNAHDQPITALGWTGRGDLVSGAKDGTVRLWQPDKEGAKELKTLAGHAHPITFLAGSPAPTTNYLASGAADGTVILWNLATGAKEFELKGHDGPISALSFDPRTFTPSPGSLLVATRTGLVVVWQLPPATKQPQTLNTATWLP